MKYKIIAALIIAGTFHPTPAIAVTGTCSASTGDPMTPRLNPTTITWCNPITNVDGSDFDPTLEQATATMKCGDTVGTYPYSAPLYAGTYPATRETTQSIITPIVSMGLADGIWFCIATVTNTDGLESDNSNTVAIELRTDAFKIPDIINDLEIVN